MTKKETAMLMKCPACGKTGDVPDTFVGKKIRCQGCRTEIRVQPKPAEQHGHMRIVLIASAALVACVLCLLIPAAFLGGLFFASKPAAPEHEQLQPAPIAMADLTKAEPLPEKNVDVPPPDDKKPPAAPPMFNPVPDKGPVSEPDKKAEPPIEKKLEPEPGKKQPDKKSTAFDPKDLQRTLRWIADESEKRWGNADRENIVGKQIYEKKWNETIATLKGQEIDWVFNGGSLGTRAVVDKKVQTVGAAIARSPKAPAVHQTKSYDGRSVLYGIRVDSVNGGFIVEPEGWVLQYKYFDPIRVRGKIADATYSFDSLTEGGLGYCVTFTISDYRLQPAEKLPEQKQPPIPPPADPPPTEKPLILKELIDRWAVQKKERFAAGRTGNQNKVEMVEKAHWDERVSWRKKSVTGAGKVTEVKGPTVMLDVHQDPNSLPWTVGASAKEKDDPILKELVRGDIVEMRGVLSTAGKTTTGADFDVRDCVFTLKK